MLCFRGGHRFKSLEFVGPEPLPPGCFSHGRALGPGKLGLHCCAVIAASTGQMKEVGSCEALKTWPS